MSRNDGERKQTSQNVNKVRTSETEALKPEIYFQWNIGTRRTGPLEPPSPSQERLDFSLKNQVFEKNEVSKRR